jgi:hypothetical protein
MKTLAQNRPPKQEEKVVAKQPQNVKAEEPKVTAQVTEQAAEKAPETEIKAEPKLSAKTLAEMARGREILAARAGEYVPEPEPSPNVIVNLGPTLPALAKEASISRTPGSSAIPG